MMNIKKIVQNVRNGSFSNSFSFAIFFLGIVALTNRFLNIQENLEKLHQYDSGMYYTIAKNAPHLPILRHFEETALKYNLEGFNVGVVYLQRLTYPYFIGIFSKMTCLPLDLTFLVAAFALLGLILFNFDTLLKSNHISFQGRVLAISLLVFNPYFSRYYLMNPYMVTDLGFIFGLSVFLLGLKRQSWLSIILGLTIAILGRQTALILFPALAAILIFETQFKKLSIQNRFFGFVSSLGFAIIPYKIITGYAINLGLVSEGKQIFYSFFGLFVWTHDWLTQSTWLFKKFALNFSNITGISSRAESVPTFYEFINFFSRISIPWTSFIVTIVATILLRSKKRYGIPLISNYSVLQTLVIFFALIIQPLGLGPYCVSDWSRYTALGLLPLGTFTFILADPVIKRFSLKQILILWIPILLSSFHHAFSMLSLGSENAWKFALIYFSILIFLFGSLLRHFSKKISNEKEL